MKIFSGSAALLAKAALDSHLYEDGGYLANELRFAIDRPNGRLIALAQEKDQVVGVALVTINKQIMAFVLPEYRRRGVGQGLVDCIVQASNLPKSRFWALWGNEVKATESFWGKCRIPLPNVRIP